MGASAHVFFSLKASFLFSFPASAGFQNVFLAPAAASAVALPAIRARTLQRGRHLLTLAVTARKRARPISKAGRCQPKCGSGRAPFQIFPACLHRGLYNIIGTGRKLLLSVFWPLQAHHLPAQVGGLDPPGAPAPQVNRHLSGHGHDGFFARGFGRLGMAQNGPPFFDQLAARLPDH